MGKIRVYQLAKELNVQSALVLELLDLLGQDVKSDLSTLDEATAELVRARVTTAIEAEKKRIAEEEPVPREEEKAPAAASGGEPLAEPEAVAAKSEAGEEPAAAAESGDEAAAASPSGRPSGPETAPPMAAAPPAPELPPGTKPAAAEPGPAATPAAASAQAPPPAPPGKRPPRVFAAKRIPTKAMLRSGLLGKTGPGRSAPPPRAGRTVPPTAPPRQPMPGRPARATPPVGVRDTGAKRRRKKDKADSVPLQPAVPKPKAELPPVPETISLSEAVTVKELAEKLNRKSKDVIAKLLTRGVLATINQPLDPETAVAIAKDFGSDATILSFEEEVQKEAEAAPAPVEGAEDEAASTHERVVRPPVVTVMGHVDHGKTSLLDAIRKSNVVEGEHGGITQHIGAYQVEINDRKITFLDTPGHEAFTLMRARGAKVTDIVVLVVAADDGVKPQTIEAIDHAKAAGVPIVVAVNKIDKPGAQPDRVKQQLADHELLVEEYGGTAVSCLVSAKKRTGIEELLEMILLVADLQELKASPAKPASGVVLEARLDRARGVVATVLVQDGTVKVGDPFIAGTAFGKIRAMNDEFGARVEDVGPSTPVEVMGLQGEPAAGDTFQVVADESKARQIAAFRQEKARQASLAKSSRRTLESLSLDIAKGEVKELSILLKADVQGSIEALQKSLSEIPADKVRISVLRASTGAITQADVLLAAASNAIVVGFNVRPDRASAELAKQEEVELRLYTVIYDVVNEIKQAMVGMLEPTLKETVLGQAEIRELFKVPKVGIVAGCYVTDGSVKRNAEVRLVRDHVVIYTGKVGSLRRFKDDVGEVKAGYECGIGIANYNDIKVGDVIEFFVIEKVAAESL